MSVWPPIPRAGRAARKSGLTPRCGRRGPRAFVARAAVQGQPCAVCGTEDGGPRVAGHKEALVQEYYRTGKIDKTKMREVSSIRPECPTCSAKEGGWMSQFSKYVKQLLGFDDDQPANAGLPEIRRPSGRCPAQFDRRRGREHPWRNSTGQWLAPPA